MKAVITLMLQYSVPSYSQWDYDHQSEWSHDFSMCDSPDQSPIDIQSSEAVINNSICDSTFEWDIDVTKQTFQITNNGHALSMKPVEQTEIPNEYIALTDNETTIGTFPNYLKPSSSPHDLFCLYSIHFHWGLTDDTGSEHLIDGHQYPIEAHFVHYSCQHSSIGPTIEQFPTEQDVSDASANGVDTHQMATVSILFDVVDNRTNPAFDVILNNISSVLYATSPGAIVNLNLFDLIPDDDISTAGYYAYEGSFTSPPCSNIVRWHVMNARGYIGVTQLEKFRELMHIEGHPIAPNYRDVQDNVNTVYSCVKEPPTIHPSSSPTVDPSSSPTIQPSSSPTTNPSSTPTIQPSSSPTTNPSSSPTIQPSASPTISPANIPSISPSSSLAEEHEEEEKEALSWWTVATFALMSSLVTAMLMGIMFMFIYKNQQKALHSGVYSQQIQQNVPKKNDEPKYTV